MTKQQIKEINEISVTLANVCAHIVDHGKIELGTQQSKSMIGAWRKLQYLLNTVDK